MKLAQVVFAAYLGFMISPHTSCAQTTKEPDLSGLTSDERQSIQMACSSAKVLEGPASYDKCLRNQLAQLSDSARQPDLSGLTSDERQSIQMACSSAKVLEGPASYDKCLREKLTDLHGVQSQKSATRVQPTPDIPNLAQVSSATGPEIKRLDYYIGDWTLVGNFIASSFSPEGKLNGTQHNEWASDHTSVISRWNEDRPDGNDSGNAVYSYDPIKKVYTYHGTDTAGEVENSSGTLDGKIWTWASTPELTNGQTVSGRFTIQEVSPTSYRFKFEILQWGQWIAVMDGRATKLAKD